MSSGPLCDYLHLRAVGRLLCLSIQGSLSPKRLPSPWFLLCTLAAPLWSGVERDSSAHLNLGWPMTNLTNSLWRK